jgi:uncharacterized membrane protein
MLVPRLLHIVLGTIWVGGAFYYNFVLLPKLRTTDARTQRVVTESVTRVMGPLFGACAIVTIASGVVLLFQLKADHEPNFITTGWGLSLVAGVVATVVAIVLVFAVELPAGRKLARLAAAAEGGEPSADPRQLRALADRVILMGRLGTGLVLLALASMPVAAVL